MLSHRTNEKIPVAAGIEGVVRSVDWQDPHDLLLGNVHKRRVLSPSEVVKNRVPSAWTAIPCTWGPTPMSPLAFNEFKSMTEIVSAMLLPT